jgi:hypothetical protein
MSVGNTTRFLSVNLQFRTSEKKLESYHSLCLTSIYFPHSGYRDQDIENFNNDVSDFLSSILSKNNTTHIIGADTNSFVGIKISAHNNNSNSMPDKHESQHGINPILELLGPHGNPHKSKTGARVLNLMREHRLKAASTFINNNRKYNTWLGLPNPATEKKAHQIDHILIPYHQLCLTSNVKRKFNGAVSDHVALLVEYHLLNSSLLKNNQKKKATVEQRTRKFHAARLWSIRIPGKHKLTPSDAIYLTPSDILNNFENHIVMFAKEAATTQTRTRPDWFSQAEHTLVELINKRNEAFKK